MLDYYLSKEQVENYRLLSFENGFLLGEIQNNDVNGFGARIWYQNTPPSSLYIGQWRDGMRNGTGFYFMTSGDCYYGEFVNNNFQGERSHLVGANGSVEFVATFFNDEIQKVHSCSGPFTYNGKHFNAEGNKRGSSNDGNGCWGCVSVAILVIVLYGIYSYCSSWMKTQEPSSSLQTELYESTTTYVCTARQSLKVRISPSASASQIGSIMSDEEVEVYSIADGFAKICYNGDVGFASAKYLRKK
jgi:hypothetical protein